MTYSAVGLRPNESPREPFVRRDWVALIVICLLAVAIRACIMTLLPSILHPDERDWLEAADRLVNHQGLLTWDFQVGERSWLWPGLIAGFMAIGQLFGARPDASLGGVAVLMCIISLAPVICGFLWGRNVAGFAGAVTTGLLNAVWFELVYFYSHPLSETAASAALVTGLYLSYPGRNGWSERQLFVGAAMLGLAAVLRPQLVPAVAVAVIAVGGIRLRAHYPALLGGLALPIALSGLLDWVTWGWPFHATVMYVYYSTKVSSAAGINPFYSYIGWEWVSWGFFSVVIVLCALNGALRLPLLFGVAVTIFVVHSAVSHKEYRYISPALPLIMTLAGIGSTMAADWLAVRLGRPAIGACCWSPCRWVGPSPPSLWRCRRTAYGSGFDLAARSWRCKLSTRTRTLVGSEFIPAICGGAQRATPVCALASLSSTPEKLRTRSLPTPITT